MKRSSEYMEDRDIVNRSVDPATVVCFYIPAIIYVIIYSDAHIQTKEAQIAFV